MTDNKDNIKSWLAALANDDYVEADKQFPNVVKGATQDIINKNKAKVIEQLNKDVDMLAAKSIQEQPKPEDKK